MRVIMLLGMSEGIDAMGFGATSWGRALRGICGRRPAQRSGERTNDDHCSINLLCQLLPTQTSYQHVVPSRWTTAVCSSTGYDFGLNEFSGVQADSGNIRGWVVFCQSDLYEDPNVLGYSTMGPPEIVNRPHLGQHIFYRSESCLLWLKLEPPQTVQ